MYTDSEEEERKREERLRSLVSEDESTVSRTQQYRMSTPIIRQPIGFQWSANDPPANTHNAPPAQPSGSYPPSETPASSPSRPSSKSQGKSKSSEGRSKKRKPRSPVQYIKWLPGDPPPGSATLAAANTPGATTFVGDSSLYLSTDPHKLSPFVEKIKKNVESKDINFNYYQPVEEVWAPDGTRIMPIQTPELEGLNIPAEYSRGPSTSQHPQYQEVRSSNNQREQRHSHRHENPDDHSNTQHSNSRPRHQHQGSVPNHRQHHGSSSTTSIPLKDSTGSSAVPVPAPQKPPPHLRILTLLIEDLRRDEGERDLLAEIKVSLKKADNPQDGFWADAKDVCKELQASPARIDGPAKAFTRRGKYKQYFLRVTARGTDEYSSANLRVEKDRTLQVFIEGAPEPLYEPITHSPPRLMTPSSVTVATNSPRPFASHKRRHDDISRLSEPREIESSPRPVSVTEDIPPPKKKQNINLTTNTALPGSEGERSIGDWGEIPISTPLSNVSDGDGPTPQPTTVNVKHEPEVSNPEVNTHTIPNEAPSLGTPPPQQDPQLDRSKSSPSYRGLVTGSESHKRTESDQAVIRWLKSFITQEQGWDDFVKSRRTTLTVREQLKHYGYIESQFNRFVGRKTPPDLEGASSCLVTRTLVINSFGLSTAWGETCTETLKLVELYGPGGSRLEDQRVVDMMDESPAVTTGMHMREFLKLLWQIDEEWDNDHPVDSSSEDGGE